MKKNYNVSAQKLSKKAGDFFIGDASEGSENSAVEERDRFVEFTAGQQSFSLTGFEHPQMSGATSVSSLRTIPGMESTAAPILALPAGWEQSRTEDGKIFYLNHNDKSTHWCHPLERDPGLPPGWENVLGPQGVYYMNHANGETSLERPVCNQPCIASAQTVDSLSALHSKHSTILIRASMYNKRRGTNGEDEEKGN